MALAASTAEALDRIEHIVVVMLENRSFDHVLGYLGLPGHSLPDHGELPAKVDGLSAGSKNTYNERDYAPGPLNEAIFADLHLDPPHDAKSVTKQLANAR